MFNPIGQIVHIRIKFPDDPNFQDWGTIVGETDVCYEVKVDDAIAPKRICKACCKIVQPLPPSRQLENRPRIITIEVTHEGFTVREVNRFADRLCWDEMLGQIALMTARRADVNPDGRYRMATVEEEREREHAQEARISQSRLRAEGYLKRGPFDDELLW